MISTTQMTSDLLTQLSAGEIAVSLILGYAIAVIPLWFIFKKAGIASWKALIPIYNVYLQFKLAWGAKWFWITLALAFAVGIFSAIITMNIGLAIFFGMFLVVAWICTILIEVLYCLNLSKSFGHGIGYMFGLIFLSIIFLYILAFGKSKYIGPAGVKPKKSRAVKAKN